MTYGTRFSEKVRIDIDGTDSKSNGIVNMAFSTDPNGDTQSNDRTINKDVEGVKNDNKNSLYKICCINSYDNDCEVNNTSTKKLSAEEEAILSANDAKEPPLLRSINNFMAIIVLAFASFIWGYYA